MANEEKKFGGSLLGYNKDDVNSYMETLIKSYNEKIWEKDTEISKRDAEIKSLKENIAHIAEENKKLTDELNSLEDIRDKIANTFIDAQIKAEEILENARIQAAKEKNVLEVENEALREVIVERKETIRNIKNSAKSFSEELRESLTKKMEDIQTEIQTLIDGIQIKYFSEEDIKDNDVEKDIARIAANDSDTDAEEVND